MEGVAPVLEMFVGLWRPAGAVFGDRLLCVFALRPLCECALRAAGAGFEGEMWRCVDRDQPEQIHRAHALSLVDRSVAFRLGPYESHNFEAAIG